MALYMAEFQVAQHVSGPVAVGRHLGDQVREDLLEQVTVLPEHGILICDFRNVSVVDYDWARAAVVPAYDAVTDSPQAKYLVLRVYHAAIRDSLLTGIRWQSEHMAQQIEAAKEAGGQVAQIEMPERELTARLAREVAVVQTVLPTEQCEWHYLTHLVPADVNLLERIRHRGNVRAIDLVDDAGAESDATKKSLARLTALRLVYVMAGAEAPGDALVWAFDRLLAAS
jgi:hypothetical protein